jgi:hypothetical protein
MAHADRRFTAEPTQQELDAGLNAAWQRRWNRGPRLRITATDDAWRSLNEEAASGPVLWEETDDGTQLYIGESTFTLCHRDNNRYLMAVTASETAAADRLRAWYDSRRSQNGPRLPRGFCPAVLSRETG